MTRERIPGEHDLTTAARTQPGRLGGTGFGDDLPATDIDTSLTEEGRRQSRWEGGGRTPGTSDDVDESPERLVPRPGPDTEAHPGERKPDEETPGSAPDTSGGVGPDAHRKTSA